MTVNTILLYGHAGNHNLGCEAIIRSTYSILKEHLKRINVLVSTNDYMADFEIDLGADLKWINSRNWGNAERSFPLRHIYAFERRILRGAFLQLLQYMPTIKASRGANIAFSVGGDNYSESPAVFLSALDKQIRKQCQRTILWGCSLDPDFLATSNMKIANIKAFDLITARESITYEGLLNHRVTKEKVHLHADPAFVMQPEETMLPQGFVAHNTVGINISPLIRQFEAVRGGTLHSMTMLIDHIINSTDMQVILIPHVISGLDDRIPLKQLFERFEKTNRVLSFNHVLNSPQTKHIISQCRMFIGARTHSTIAAYSTCIPTLALGYSVKARGIARDIFGSEEGLVLPVQTLTSEQQLIHAFEGLREREDELRQHLKAVMPAYIQSAWDAGKHIAELL